jgi:hypothetical protein
MGLIFIARNSYASLACIRFFAASAVGDEKLTSVATMNLVYLEVPNYLVDWELSSVQSFGGIVYFGFSRVRV